MSIDSIPSLVRKLYRIVAQLEALFPQRRFTLDGHLVGSLGEVLAADWYNLELLPASAEGHDAQAPDGRLVQIKATQRNSVGLRSLPNHLIVLRLLPSGEGEEVYNGPGADAWSRSGRMQKNGQRPITVAALRQIMESVPAEARLSRREE